MIATHITRPAQKFLALITSLALMLTLTACDNIQREFPSKKIQVLVGYGAGGLNDSVARALAASLEDVSGQTVLVVNRPGAGGIIAATEAMLAPKEGYNLFLAPSAAFTSSVLLHEVKYSAEDFAGVAAVSQQPFVLVTAGDQGTPPKENRPDIHSIEDLQKDREVVYGAYGEGHATHMITALFLKDAHIPGRVVPFESTATAAQSVINREVDLAAIDLPGALPRIASGELRALAISGGKRSPALPEVPSFSELGYERSDFSGSQGLVAPSGVDPETLQKLRELTQEALQSPRYQEFIESSKLTFPADTDGERWLHGDIPAEHERFNSAYQELGVGK